MHLTDKTGVALSTPHADARDAFDAASELLLGYYGDPIAAMEPALRAHPDFAMGHLFVASAMLTATDRRLEPHISASLDAAEACVASANERERAHLTAARAWLAGDWQRANEGYGALVDAFPHDTLALQMAHLGDFFLGRRDALRDRPAAALRHWNDAMPRYGFVLGMHAFGLEECGDYDRAEATGHTALALNRRDPWSVHAVAHVYEMQGRIEDGVRWLEDRAADWAPDNGFAYHNWWHLALHWLELEEYARVLDLYDSSVRPHDSDTVLELIDATALLWRLNLRGVDVGERWQPLLARWQARCDDRLYVFNDLHALMALLACERFDAADALLESIAGDHRGIGAHAAPAREAALITGRGLIAFSKGRYEQAIDDLMEGHRRSAAFGGSLAQRDLIALTALACSERGTASPALAAAGKAVSSARREARPDSPFAWSATANWRQRHDSDIAGAHARAQADQSRREWLRRLAIRHDRAA